MDCPVVVATSVGGSRVTSGPSRATRDGRPGALGRLPSPYARGRGRSCWPSRWWLGVSVPVNDLRTRYDGYSCFGASQVSQIPHALLVPNRWIS